ncbi:16S rRNA (guanine(527)-N(7))-methyltransferase RsmG [Candidatus Xianfuyuplasma coldseepsis]|uniref:Ribosomal RNA small subunit methyltransferase G n=1 Tax=Candidatus Xianfuyuplasma coldseepsis TaxID=2782163 RepID=A0A7L7KRZ9_9MOLU|nr:16S rRNA (guanine(527)-N(7))-methyltransferase RsmG [Xianfuyuplasma coldseepsis]QMS85032.1 16S rRNA (guanine(527)-N(7))-methyltransferase RsmG [Xianfuyuplasma coldseepsis]
MIEQFQHMLEECGIQLSPKQEQQFAHYYNLLMEWNSKLNLTSITEKEEVYLKHFYDSICLTKAISLSNQTILDVGSGAGFPSIPLKIIFPDLQITIIDALQKRVRFLHELTDTLGISVELIHGRAEEFSRRETYDIVTARAVSNLRMLCELCIPFVKHHGVFLAMKGPGYQEEVIDSKNTIQILGGTLEDTILYHVNHFERSIVVVRKTATTPTKYPRRYNKIKSKPL